MTLVPAQLTHVQGIVPIMEEYRKFCGFDSKEEQTQAFLTHLIKDNKSVMLLVIEEQSQQIMGFVNLYPSYSTLALQPIWLLNDLAVSRQFRGRGLAKFLINGALEFAKESGAIRIEFKTEMTNTRAQALYNSLGFSIDKDNVYYRVTC